MLTKDGPVLTDAAWGALGVVLKNGRLPGRAHRLLRAGDLAWEKTNG